MPANARQLILQTLKHAVGWHEDRIKENLCRFHKIPFEATATELTLMVSEGVVERTDDGFVSLPDKTPISLFGIVTHILSMLRTGVHA